MKAIKKRTPFKKLLPYWLLSLPAIIYLFIFSYAPMVGAVIAFKDYKVRDGIFGSEWVGLRNFKYFFTSIDASRILRNTILYNLAFLLLTGVVLAAIIALMLYEVKSKVASKIYHTSMLIPHYMSYVVIAAIALIFLNPNTGLFNSFRNAMGMESIMWYSEPKYWPFILTFINIWRDVGFASLYLYASLLAIDTNLFEAAQLDGAGKLRQIWHISIPSMAPMLCFVIISRLGIIMNGDLGLFQLVPMDSGALYSTTDIIATYIYRGLQASNFSYTAAVGLFQSVVGLILVLISNSIIRKISPENAMF